MSFTQSALDLAHTHKVVPYTISSNAWSKLSHRLPSSIGTPSSGRSSIVLLAGFTWGDMGEGVDASELRLVIVVGSASRRAVTRREMAMSAATHAMMKRRPLKE